MLKALIAMPQTSHFGMSDTGGFADRHIPCWPPGPCAPGATTSKSWRNAGGWRW